MTKKEKVSASVQDKYKEILYDEKQINTKSGPVKLRLQGKINCPVLNHRISWIVCCKFMDKPGWPRAIDPNICCDGANCFVYKSLQKNSKKKKK